MKVTYIQHSSFCIEFEQDKIVLLFDYYEGDLPEWEPDSHIYVFASHKHFDHYSKKIFAIGEKYEHTEFILDKEIKMNTKYMDRCHIPMVVRDKITYVTNDYAYCFNQKMELTQQEQITKFLPVDSTKEQTENNEIMVRTLDSTDSGVAYVIDCAGKCIYHAGDLNWWTWIGETDQEYQSMTERFQKEIEKVSINSNIQFDVAFLPLDPRQEERFYWGFDYFMRHCNVRAAFPMHMWKDYSVVAKILELEESVEYRDRIYRIEKENQEFNL